MPGPRLNLNPEDLKNGLAQLVLTLVRLLHELMERQALHRLEAGSLSDEQIEKIGTTLMRQAEEIDRLRVEFNLEEEDLNLDLGPLGKLL
ncbi:MAG: gas vesicle protein K [Desulfarculaceae bacterium]|nr:gas vesicle protein K [Desulfarculaceae bacterium]MCF8049470.1 gas vesicle protein K [Desulfarculaceae bacterium]MCF8064146.1 gas vesicle protein K [Desulfarculaceae bacterium]MCF8097138.1 gas vesicle protein K [Desulfarculaceae bacterium]